VFSLCGARRFEVPVDFDKADLAVAGDAQIWVKAEGRDEDSVPFCNLEYRFSGDKSDFFSVNGDKPALKGHL
jgi:hypothetical protein